MSAPEIYREVMRGILTPIFLEINIFWYTGQLIFSKIIKIVAISCQILRLKCTKFDFGWGSAADPAGGAYSSPPDPLAGFNGASSKYGRHDFDPSQKIVPACMHTDSDQFHMVYFTKLCSLTVYYR